MKFNWGAKLMVFFGGFVALIIFMVIKSTQQNTDLVATDYYAREVAYQDKINRQEEANKVAGEVSVKLSNTSVDIQLPMDGNDKSPSGKLTFLRPSDKKLDRNFDIMADSSGTQSISLSEFTTGLYKVEIEWEADQLSYFMEKTLIIP